MPLKRHIKLKIYLSTLKRWSLIHLHYLEFLGDADESNYSTTNRRRWKAVPKIASASSRSRQLCCSKFVFIAQTSKIIWIPISIFRLWRRRQDNTVQCALRKQTSECNQENWSDGGFAQHQKKAEINEIEFVHFVAV